MILERRSGKVQLPLPKPFAGNQTYHICGISIPNLTFRFNEMVKLETGRWQATGRFWDKKSHLQRFEMAFVEA